jgi:hypothetical protein
MRSLVIATALATAAGAAIALSAAPASALPCPKGTRYTYVYGTVGACMPYAECGPDGCGTTARD